MNSNYLIGICLLWNPKEKSNIDVNVEAIPLNLGEMVQYQEGSVVSREFYQKSAGSITLFAFAEKQGLKEHSHSL